jgi:hypothetical protein
MAHGIDKERSRRNRAKVRELFMREWDPIGVRDVPQATDEYDSYVAKAYVMLMDEGASENAIADYLGDIATRYMGLSPTEAGKTACRRTASMLVAMRSEFESP